MLMGGAGFQAPPFGVATSQKRELRGYDLLLVVQL